MAETFLDLVNAILSEIGEDEVESIESASVPSTEIIRIKHYLNKAYREIFRAKSDWAWARFPFTLTTVSGTSAYSLDASANPEKLHSVQVSGYPPLELLSYGEFKRKYGEFEGTVTGQPHIAYVLGGQLYLYPTPGSAYTVKYVASKKWTKLVNNTDEPLIPDASRDLIEEGALWRELRHEGEPYQDILQVYMAGVKALSSSEDNNHKGYAIIPEDETISAEYGECILSDYA